MDMTPDPATTRDISGESSVNTALKRRRKKSDDIDSNDSEYFANDDNGKQQTTKRARTRGNFFGCTYRKGNPRFNVRDYDSCALNPFADMALLK